MKITTPNGEYTLDCEPTPELIKRLSKPYRKPPIRKPDYSYTIEEAEAHGVKFPHRERIRRENLSLCDRFNAKFKELSGTSLNGMEYRGVEEPVYCLRFNLPEEERNALLKRHGIKLTGLSEWNRHDAATKILRGISQTIQDDLLQEESGDTVNREKCRIWNERYFAAGGIGSGYEYRGNEEPELLQDYDRVDENILLVRNGVKLTGLSERKRLCKVLEIISNIRQEVEK